eukprot:gene12353-16567_t
MDSNQFANEFLAFLNHSCSAFHAVEFAKAQLIAVGYEELSEKAPWNIAKGNKYFFTRNDTTIIAFDIGSSYESGGPLTVIGAHTDSPCFKIKPITCFKKNDALVLNTQPYGGGLWHTWFDRDLGLAGRAIIRADASEASETQRKLFRIDRPIARIPNLAIHLTSGTERERFEPNLHEHAQAILSMDPDVVNMIPTEEEKSVSSRIHPYLLRAIAEQLGISSSQIEDVELQLIDLQPSTLGGATNELLYSGRLDNLCSAYQALRALIDAPAKSEITLAAPDSIRMCLLFDHEEIGSNSFNGAGSSIFMDTIKILNEKLSDGSSESLLRMLSKSFVVSADMAHAIHPNYAGKHDPTMAPKINNGLVIKHNANMRYATNSVSASLFRRIGKLAGVPVQEFAVRNGSACGSTIGPILSTLSGILTVDCGTPQFSMHSIREMMGTKDAYTGYLHMMAVYEYHTLLTLNST